MYYSSYNYICFYIYVLDSIMNKVSFSQCFLFISRTCLALIILRNEHICQKYVVFKHRSTYAVFQLARKPSERINRVSRGLTVPAYSFRSGDGSFFWKTRLNRHFSLMYHIFQGVKTKC
jgi:hypothetical protein